MIDQDAVVACADLVGRSGGRQVEVGYLDDDVPVTEARWYAKATFRGTVLIADERKSPDEACDALARRILDGGACTHCYSTVTLTDDDDGCRWRRTGAKWKRGCG